MSQVQIIDQFGTDIAVPAGDFYLRLDEARRGTSLPFASGRMDLVSRVGQTIFKESRATASPFVTHFAFWIRAASLQKLSESFYARLPPQTQARARGLVFHLPPQNVETIFLYSWVLSYLTGNANVLRLPGEISAEMREICNLFLNALDAAEDRSQLFVHYLSRSDLGVGISARSDARVVWGGDDKVATFAALPLRKGGKSIWFGDRFSFSVMNGAELDRLDEAEQKNLAKRIFNDVFIFGQMACSSPHAIYIVGDRDVHQPALDALLDQLADLARARGQTPATGHAIRKMVGAFASAATGNAIAVDWRRNELTRVVVAGMERQEERIGGGYLRTMFIPSLSALAQLVRGHDQTITHFGFTPVEISEAARTIQGEGVSRWAPVGSALDFDFVWDGYDIPFELTRLVRVT